MNERRRSSHESGIPRRMFLNSVVFATLAMLMLGNAIAQERPTSPRILTFSDHQPADRMRTRFLKDVLFPAIEKESNGNIRIESHWNGDLAAAYDALDAVSSGKVDIATTVPEYTAEELPLHQIFKSFPVGPTADKQIKFFQRVYEEVPDFTAELEKNNIVPIFFGTGYPVAFYSTEPLTNLDGIVGGTWRSASFWHLDFLKNAGAEPIRIHWGPKVYEAMRNKTLDGLMVNVDSGYFLNIHDTAPNVLVSKALWLGHVYPLTMNKDVWNDLTQEDKSTIRRAVATSYQALGAVMNDSFDAQLDALTRAGAKLRVLDPDEVERFGEVTQYEKVQAAWIKKQESKGITDTGKVLAKVKLIMNEIMN